MDLNNKPTIKSSKLFILSVFFVLYLIVFWLSFFSKGIFVQEHFYRKSSNLTAVTYTCRNPFAEYKKIVLQKQVDKDTLTIDGAYTVNVYKDGTVEKSENMPDDILPGTDWAAVADQSLEGSRGFLTGQPYFLVFILYVLLALSKIYSTRVYSILFRNRAAGESYYRIFDNVFTAATIIVMVYFILPV